MGEDRQVVRLPLLVRPETDESLVGFLFRLSGRNGLPDPLDLARFVGFRFKTIEPIPFESFDFEPLAQASAVVRSELQSMAYSPVGHGGLVKFLGHRIERNLLSLRQRRACPVCLDQKPYHRAVWDLRLFSTCPLHAVRLLEACPACGQALSWRSGSITRCDCGQELSKAPAHTVPESELKGLKYLYGLLGLAQRQSVSQPLAGLPFSEALSLLLHLGWFASDFRGQPGPIRLCRHNVDAHRLINIAYEACSNWPESFHAYLNLLAERSGLPTRRAVRMRSLAHWILHRKQSPSVRQPLLCQLSRYLDDLVSTGTDRTLCSPMRRLAGTCHDHLRAS